MSKSKQSKQPAERREPSARDREIYLQVKAHRAKQKDLAKHNGMSKSRVSQIMKNVEAWFADVSPRDGELDHDQRLRLERRIERERLEKLYAESLRMLAEFEQPAEAARLSKEGECLGKTKRDRSAQRVQALKSALRVAESLGKLAEREPAPLPPEAKGHLRADVLFGHLTREREAAEAKGVVAATPGCTWDVIYYVLGALQGDLLDPIDPTSVLAGALTQIVERLVGLVGLGAGGGWVVAATTQAGGGSDATVPARDPLCFAAAAKHRHPESAGGAQLPQLDRASLLAGCPPEIAATLAASGWPDRFYGAGASAEEASAAGSLAREKTSELSARGPGGCVVAATTQAGSDPGDATVPAGDPLCFAAAATHSHPEPAAKHSHAEPARPAPPPEVGSPEWQIARKQWLKERDERVAAEHDWRLREKLAREEDLRQRRAAAHARWRWLEAGRVEY